MAHIVAKKLDDKLDAILSKYVSWDAVRSKSEIKGNICSVPGSFVGRWVGFNQG